MKSYTQGRNLAGTWTKKTDATHLTYIDQVANDDYRRICALKDWPFLEKRRSISTAAATQFTTLPYDCDLVREISVTPTGSTLLYTPRECTSREQWDMLNLTSTYKADIPEWYFVFGGQVGLWPIPVNAGNTIYVTQKTRVIDLSAADYTTGTIVSIASGAAAVVGSGTAWTSQMVGRYIRITYSDTANTGDGLWYEIASVTDATHLTLTRNYGGTSISAGSSAYTIGQMPLLPEAFHDLPWMWASGDYWQKEADNDGRATYFFNMHGQAAQGNQPATGKVKDLIASYSSNTTGMVLDYGVEKEQPNPNLLISL